MKKVLIALIVLISLSNIGVILKQQPTKLR